MNGILLFKRIHALSKNFCGISASIEKLSNKNSLNVSRKFFSSMGTWRNNSSLRIKISVFDFCSRFLRLTRRFFCIKSLIKVSIPLFLF